MRYRHLLFGVALLVPVIAASQATPNPRNPERFDVAGLPQTANSALEKEIFNLLRYHKRGDLRDATRIHLMLAEYYKDVGDKTRADDCTKMANEAWEAAEKGVRTSAGTSGTQFLTTASPPQTYSGTASSSNPVYSQAVSVLCP